MVGGAVRYHADVLGSHRVGRQVLSAPHLVGTNVSLPPQPAATANRRVARAPVAPSGTNCPVTGSGSFSGWSWPRLAQMARLPATSWAVAERPPRPRAANAMSV